jgi:uncharacterized membrane protein YwzB
MIELRDKKLWNRNHVPGHLFIMCMVWWWLEFYKEKDLLKQSNVPFLSLASLFFCCMLWNRHANVEQWMQTCKLWLNIEGGFARWLFIEMMVLLFCHWPNVHVFLVHKYSSLGFIPYMWKKATRGCCTS